jgi:hypothetical protein
MQRLIINGTLLAGITLVGIGCGNDNGLLRPKGRVVKGGEAFVPDEGTYLQVYLVPIFEDGKPPDNFYAAEVDQETGVFRPAGAMKEGIPPGKYRVCLELRDKKKKDQFGGKFDVDGSPYVFDYEEGMEEVVIDLDAPPPPSVQSLYGARSPSGG